MSKKISKVYLAGPDVFRSREDAACVFADLKERLRHYGIEGLSPLDGELSLDFSDLAPYEKAAQIFLGNMKLIDQCDAVLANITPFRGPSCDPGTAWEIGYAVAKGKLVFGYSNGFENSGLPDHTYKRRIDSLEKVGLKMRTDEYPGVEDFGLIDNLMIARSLTTNVAPNAQVAIIWMHKWYKEAGKLIDSAD